ncbi:UDP-N-acetylmuramoyl-L-alanyl-D-glutamate--2,6-diaminopimelate ligase [Paenalkalicoccus suaedae]|uniref:UDP-N-acetylmuramoyl-L-alanyl-D-glutamate--2,6-diaminopimelate ligase n=1 Tax=Paenalkalicoccus suaedae TaxID=2592382 RepID=A0A859FH57_9BACI|nr:UDP-N-acetylmuramoyl-L-alanyl-D-glutamate--2,6-diaminopimelate ligase [Paenalkalicoccus suaedae]QKS71526.1 UDP-N-acetylmuramoyl-L-alanyl-D-glutamate--2,6-diaminopimelate ligase [Paenalkalicoccus suaedae]
MKLRDLEALLPVSKRVGQNQEDIDILHIEMDSRTVSPGTLFFCVPGYTVDGHDFATQAVENGASALVVDRELDVNVPMILVPNVRRAMAQLATHFYDNPSKHLRMIGVTGTNGKTSVTHFLDQLLTELGAKTGLIGTMYAKYVGKEVATSNTTPESLVLQRTLRDMCKEGVETVAMEVSSHALELGRSHGTSFEVAVFTNLSQDHLDYHETMNDYAHAKSLLFSQLGNTFDRHRQPKAVINNDDAYAGKMIASTAAPVLTYGLGEADFQAIDVRLTPSKTSFTLLAKGQKYKVETHLPGKFSISNILATIVASYALGYELEQIVKIVPSLRGVPGRFEPVITEAPVHTIVDYAHTPDSLQNVLETARDLTSKRVIAVVGCGGDRDKTKRPLMARIAEDLADKVYVTSDNPRTEDPQAILDDMIVGLSKDNHEVIEDRELAIKTAIAHAEPEDVILIAGKGHETYQEIGKVKYPFDDRKVAYDALKEWK